MKPSLYLINGPLGAGKTTLLKHLLSQPEFSQARVIENEFASTDIDARQLAKHQAEVRAIAGMCICCSTGNELFSALESLAESSAEPVIVEATGVANSLVLIEKLTATKLLEYYDLRQAIFVLDGAEAVSRPELLDLYREELAAADTVLISKTDLLEPEETLDLMHRLASRRDGPTESMYNGEVDSTVLARPSTILSYYHEHENSNREHDRDSSYAIIPASEISLTPETLYNLWPHLVTTYGAERMKGAFITEGDIWHVEATPSQCRITKSTDTQEALSLVIIGTEAYRIDESIFTHTTSAK